MSTFRFLRFFAKFAKKATLVRDLCSVAFQCPNRKNRRTLKAGEHKSPTRVAIFCDFNDSSQNSQFSQKSRLLSGTSVL